MQTCIKNIVCKKEARRFFTTWFPVDGRLLSLLKRGKRCVIVLPCAFTCWEVRVKLCPCHFSASCSTLHTCKETNFRVQRQPDQRVGRFQLHQAVKSGWGCVWIHPEPALRRDRNWAGVTILSKSWMLPLEEGSTQHWDYPRHVQSGWQTWSLSISPPSATNPHSLPLAVAAGAQPWPQPWQAGAVAAGSCAGHRWLGSLRSRASGAGSSNRLRLLRWSSDWWWLRQGPRGILCH